MFPPSTVEKKEGLDYIAIEATIDRLNEVLGNEWDVVITKQDVRLLDGLTYGSRNPKPAIMATVEVSINATIDGKRTYRAGLGADIGPWDKPDKVTKTAYANAIKKAANQYGIALYLWYESERRKLELARALEAGNTGPLKAAVVQLTRDMNPALEEDPRARVGSALICETFGIENPGELAEIKTLERIIRENSILLEGY